MSLHESPNGPILKFITLIGQYFGILGALVLMAHQDGDDTIIEGISRIDPQDATQKDIIETNRKDIKTVLKNQKRMYHLQQESHQRLRGLFYKGIGLLVTLMVALMGLMGASFAI